MFHSGGADIGSTIGNLVCKLLASSDSPNQERINSLTRQSGLDDLHKAYLLRGAGDLDGAIEVYQQLLTFKQDDPPCSVLPWRWFFACPELAEHLPMELREQMSKSYSVRLHSGLADLFREKRDFVRAVSEYRAAVQIDFKDEKSRIGLIKAIEDSGDLDVAIAESKEVIRISDGIPFGTLI